MREKDFAQNGYFWLRTSENLLEIASYSFVGFQGSRSKIPHFGLKPIFEMDSS